MKTFYAIILLGFISLTLNSCSVHKNLSEISMLENESDYIKGSSDFVELNNGDKIYFNDLKLVKGLFRAPHVLGDQIHKFTGSELKAYQIDGAYAISEKQIENGHKSKLAIDALPGFAKRVVTGNLNVYSKKYFNGRAAVEEFFVQSGVNGKIYVYTPETLKTIIENKNMESQELDNSSLVVASDY